MLSNIDQLKLDAVLREIGDRRSKISHYSGYTGVFAVLSGVAIVERAVAFALLSAVLVAVGLFAIRGERAQVRSLREDQRRLEARIAGIE